MHLLDHAWFPLLSHMAIHYPRKFSPLFHPILEMRDLKLSEWDDVANVTQSPYIAAVRVQVTRLPVFLPLTQGNLSLLGSSTLSIVPSQSFLGADKREPPTWAVPGPSHLAVTGLLCGQV